MAPVTRVVVDARIRGHLVVHGGHLDLVDVATKGVAVTPEDIDLWCYLFGAAKQIAGVGILGNHAQCLALAAPSDQYPWTRCADRRRAAQRRLKLVVLALVGTVVVTPHLQADLDRLFETLESLGQGWERHTETPVFTFVPGRSNTKLGPATGKHIEGGHRLGQEPGMAIGHPGHEEA
jgi:hypothetical protein